MGPDILEARDLELFELAPVGYVTVGESGVIRQANLIALSMLDVSRAALIQQPLSRFIFRDDQERFSHLHQKLVATTELQVCELRMIKSDGTSFWALVSASVARDERGASELRFVLNDVTTLRKTDAELRDSAEQLRRLLQTAAEGIWTIDAASLTDYVNPKMAEMLGYSVEEMIGRPRADFMDIESRSIDAEIEMRSQQGISEKYEFRFLRKDGSEFWTFVSTNPVFDASGTYVGALAMVTDITERRRNQELLAWEKGALELTDSDASLPEVLNGLMLGLENQLPGAICSVLLLDENGTNLRHGAAPSLPEAYTSVIDGLAVGPMVGSCGTAAHAGRQVIVSDIGSDPLWADFCGLALAHDLHACWSTPIFGGEQKILGTFAIYYRSPRQPATPDLEVIARAVHITRIAIERSRAEAALRGSEQKFRILFEHSSEAILLIQGGQIVDCNRRTLEIFGCESRDQIVGHPPWEFSPPFQPDGQDSTELANEKITAAYAGQPQTFEWLHTRLDSTSFLAEVSLDTVDLGNSVLLQSIVRDITERRQAQIQREQLDRKMQEAQRLESLQVLAGGISHDFNNILAAILGNAELLRHDLIDSSPQALERLKQISVAGSRAQDLVQQILSFSRRQPIEFRQIALAPVIERSLRLLRAALPKRLTLTVECEANMPLVLADATQIEQVVIDLVSNAMQATHGGPGRIEVRLDTVKLDAAFLQTHSVLNTMSKNGKGRIVRLAVSDNGPGMDRATCERAFEPFFTTKPLGEGTGLGLSVVHGIVQEHGGVIEVESQPGWGATFTLYLAVATAQVDASGITMVPVADNLAADPEEADAVPVLKILCLDDDESVIRIVKQLLEIRGYRVSDHVNQQAALDAIRAAPGEFDVVVTDYNMPGMQGLDVAREVRAIRADLPVIVTSGYIDEELRTGAEAAGVQALIPKPFVLKELYEVIERLAQAGRQRRGR
ncbi:MAG: PAS domain S-box protein [Planctomycetota bacterium]|nr:MAG: PAS domain S-box protein [Planctomycetota bacterium]